MSTLIHQLPFYPSKILVTDAKSLRIIHRLFENVSGSIFRPVDPLLKVLFTPPVNIVSPTGYPKLTICKSFLITLSFEIIYSKKC